MEALRLNLSQGLSLPPSCVSWLLDVWEVIQTLDDLADGDAVDRDRLDSHIMRCLVTMPANQWFREHQAALIPAVATAIIKWQASDHAERNGQADEKSFVWRAGYYDLIALAVLLCHGPEAAQKVAHLVMGMYGETFADYCEEFEGGANA